MGKNRDIILSNILVFIGTLFIISSASIISLQSQSQNLLFDCLTDILPKFDAHSYALTNFNLKPLSVPRILVKFNFNIDIFIKYCPKIVLFDVRDLENSKIFDYFGTINCASSTMIILIANQSNFQHDGLKDYILYILDTKLGIYQFYDYHNRHLVQCNKFNTSKFSNSTKTTNIRIMYRDLPPFVEYKYKTGLDQIILQIILNRLDIKNTTEFQTDLSPIRKNSTTGNYTNLPLLLLQYDSVDVVAGGFLPMENDMYKDFQYSIVYATDTLNLIAPKSKIKPIWKRVMQIYSWELSIIFIIMFIFLLIFITYFYKTPPLLIISMWLYEMLLEGPVNNIQKKCTFRLPLSFILMACLISATAFKNTLTLIYFSKEYEPEIYSLEDVEESDLKFYVTHFNSTEGMKLADDKIELCQDILECALKIGYNRNYLMLFQKIPILYNMPRYFTNNITKEPLLYVGSSLQQVPYQMYFRKNYPAFDDINRLLIRIYDAGIIVAEIEKKIFIHKWNLSHGKKIGSHVLNFYHLEFLFIFWLVGVMLATLVFCGEIYFYKYCLKNN